MPWSIRSKDPTFGSYRQLCCVILELTFLLVTRLVPPSPTCMAGPSRPKIWLRPPLRSNATDTVPERAKLSVAGAPSPLRRPPSSGAFTQFCEVEKHLGVVCAMFCPPAASAPCTSPVDSPAWQRHLRGACNYQELRSGAGATRSPLTSRSIAASSSSSLIWPLACRVRSCSTTGDGSRPSARTEASAPATARSAEVICQSYLSCTSPAAPVHPHQRDPEPLDLVPRPLAFAAFLPGPMRLWAGAGSAVMRVRRSSAPVAGSATGLSSLRCN
jgi:hypothetical protein